MKGGLPRALSALAVWSVCASLWPSPAFAQCADPAARIVRLANRVEHKAPTSDVFAPATLNLAVCEGDVIRSGDRSRATIAFLDNGVVLTIEQNTEWVVRRPSAPDRTWIELIRGAILFFTRQPRSLDVQTPFVNAAVEGTEFMVRVESDRALVTVFEGVVALTNPGGTLAVTSNQSAVAVQGQAPQLVVILRPQDAVQWALYYPPVFPRDSFQQLEQIPEAARDARFHLRRAALLLGVGRLDEARADIVEAERRSPADGDVDALRAVVALALNDKDGALASGRQAVLRSPASAAARIALSYALQANFDLEGARDELLRAVMDHPDDAAAWARLAELWLSLGYVDRAGDAAERAVRLSPDDARANAVLGFAALARVDTSAARAAFEQAIVLDSSNPLARLGLGLARIREGDLAEGRRDIEIATALNPDEPIVRSYLGKAYFEEKREPLPAPQFERAEQIDPRDPTPWFYDAIRKQTLNRPVEALQDLETSIELNGDRAVYRSTLLVDQDLAARSASLGRLYRELGFEQRALVEGWRSLESDPGDYSGHRFLADTYSALPRHEVARVSELLQSQLLQPLSLTPVPPRLAETDLFILEGAGPDEPGFNEFNPLFSRNRVAAQLSVAVGNNSLVGDEATISGIWNRVSFSVGQFHYDTDGYRENNEQDRDIYNAFVQAQLSTQTSVQAEFRSDDTVTGDLTLLFDPENFSTDQTVREESTVTRVGVRHAFTPASQIIGSFYVGDRDASFFSSLGPNPFGLTGHTSSLSQTESWTAEIRHLFRAGRLSLTSGFGHFQSDRQREETSVFQFFDSESTVTQQFSDDPRQTNVYVYSLIELPEQVTLTLGASADFYESQIFSRNQVNPKTGVSWHPHPSTTVRVAAFRTLHRALVSSQTIEPTQVSGFNQFFADTEGEEALRYGMAWDQKFGSRLFGGAEFSWRDLKVPVEFVTETGTTVARFDREEQLGRAYLYLAPHDRLSVSVEYLFERFDRNEASSGQENILELRTHRFPLGIRYFSPRGWYASARAVHIDQSGSFAGLGFLPAGEDRFWVVDGAIGYRLPKRYGRVSFEVKNLFDSEFRFQDTDPGNPVVKPRRAAFVTFVLGI
jgi:tetratricopeptide (TPR) repeat protein